MSSPTYTVFVGPRRIASGDLRLAALAAKRITEQGASEPLFIFADATGAISDIDTRGSDAEVIERLAFGAVAHVPRSAVEPLPDETPTSEPRGRGRPKLGVVAREVTLLPRHWEWLNSQPGGASVALRKLVESARRTSGHSDRRREARDAAYRFMSAMCGDLPNFEEASRALFADDLRAVGGRISEWPVDLRDHVMTLAVGRQDETDTHAVEDATGG